MAISCPRAIIIPMLRYHFHIDQLRILWRSDGLTGDYSLPSVSPRDKCNGDVLMKLLRKTLSVSYLLNCHHEVWEEEKSNAEFHLIDRGPSSEQMTLVVG